jgi:hypothetical protein
MRENRQSTSDDLRGEISESGTAGHDAGGDHRRRRANLARHAVLLILATAMALAATWGCDAFAPRDPEPPEGTQPIILLSQPDSVYVSMQLGLSSEFINTYINVFDETFTFHPDRNDSLDLITELGQNVYAEPWTRQTEETAHSKIFNSLGSLELVFIGPALDSVNTVSSEVLLIRKEYELRAGEDVYKGQAEWTMERKSAEWRITHWEDIRLTQGWGFLKGTYR